MRGAYYQYCKVKGVPRLTDAVEEARQLRKEQAELRLARIMNNAEPSHKNGHPKYEEKTGVRSMPGGTKRSKRSA